MAPWEWCSHVAEGWPCPTRIEVNIYLQKSVASLYMSGEVGPPNIFLIFSLTRVDVTAPENVTARICPQPSNSDRGRAEGINLSLWPNYSTSLTPTSVLE